jgi:hypothetical protein
MSLTNIEQGLEASDRLISQAHAFIQSQIRDSFLDQIPGVDIIAATIEHLLEQAAGPIKSADIALKTQIQPMIDNAVPNIIGTVTGLAQTLASDVETLIGEIATVDDVTQTIIGEIRKQSPHLAQWLYHNVVGQFGNVALGVLETVEHEQPGMVDPILDELLRVKGLPPWLHGAISQARGRKAPFLAFVLPALILAAILPVLGALAEPVVNAVKQEAWKELPTKVTDPNTLIQALFRGMITDAQFRDEMAQSGFHNDVALRYLNAAKPLADPETATRAYLHGFIKQGEWESELTQRGYTSERARINYLAALPLLSEDAIRQSYLRNIIKQDEHDRELGQYGYSAEQAQRMRTLYFYIPGPQDLIHMGIRNVFVPEIVERSWMLRSNRVSQTIGRVSSGKLTGSCLAARHSLRCTNVHWIRPLILARIKSR